MLLALLCLTLSFDLGYALGVIFCCVSACLQLDRVVSLGLHGCHHPVIYSLGWNLCS